MCLYARDLSRDEGHRHGTNRIKIRRTQVVLASNQGYKVLVITELFHYSERYVRAIFKELKECCLKALDQESQPNCPIEFTKDGRTFIARRVKCPQFLKVSIAENLHCQTSIVNLLAQWERKLQSLRMDSAFFGSISGTGPWPYKEYCNNESGSVTARY